MWARPSGPDAAGEEVALLASLRADEALAMTRRRALARLSGDM
jgi:hypothetical protein